MIFIGLILLHIVFWLSVAGILHTYGVYPFLLSRMGRNRIVPRKFFEEGDPDWPTLNVVMAMYNEGLVIGNTLQSIVDSDYPEGKINIYVGSDNSTDESHRIVELLRSKYPCIKLEVFPGRNGKINIINSLIEQIPEDGGSILLLCDANVVWSSSLARNLARHFKDGRIGVVASSVIDPASSHAGIAAEEEAYVNLENSVKHSEGILWGRMMGAFGACYALRRSIYEPVPPNFNVDDFYQTMACYEQGYEGIVDLNAICYEAVSEEISEEFRRKKRISKGNFQNFKRFSNYLLPWNCGLPTFFAFWSHKGLRWFGPVLLILIFLTGVVLGLSQHWIYLVAVGGMIGTWLIAAIDKVMEHSGAGKRIRLFKFIRYFYAMNLALFLGGIEFCKGISNSVWEPTKRIAPGGAVPNSGK